MPSGVRHKDTRLEEAVALYLRLWPADNAEHAAQMVRASVQHRGARDTIKMLQGYLEQVRQHEGVSTEQDPERAGEGDVS